ncbi:MAG: hypothetical protein NWR22_01305, partial [Saprospiraceae bacterium]|nr:hypothetical protein [Saprospiraceae bacterium]
MNETKVFRMKKNIVIIPARYKSIRFPGKPLAKISQKSMNICYSRTPHDLKISPSLEYISLGRNNFTETNWLG